MEEHYRERNNRHDDQRTSANFFTRESAVDMEDVAKQARDYHSHEHYLNEVSQAETERVHDANRSAQRFRATSAEFPQLVEDIRFRSGPVCNYSAVGTSGDHRNAAKLEFYGNNFKPDAAIRTTVRLLFTQRSRRRDRFCVWRFLDLCCILRASRGTASDDQRHSVPPVACAVSTGTERRVIGDGSYRVAGRRSDRPSRALNFGSVVIAVAEQNDSSAVYS